MPPSMLLERKGDAVCVYSNAWKTLQGFRSVRMINGNEYAIPFIKKRRREREMRRMTGEAKACEKEDE